MVILGCIADDFTGAGDAASFLKKGGLEVRLFNGVPDGDVLESDRDEAWVIALKTRAQEKTQAVRAILAALDFLQKKRAGHIYIKYCSTFDSTREGNIGPCVDAVLEAMGQTYTILCPALPVNGRTVRDGVLYVNGVPLAQSPMKDHPLTPMWDSRISRLMERQSRYPCMVVSKKDIGSGKAGEKIAEFGKGKEHFYVIPDLEEMADIEGLVRSFGSLPLLTGGSGILEGLAAMWTGRRGRGQAAMRSKGTSCGQAVMRSEETAHGQAPMGEHSGGRALILAGSCSAMTRIQIREYREQGGSCLKLDPIQLYEGRIAAEGVWQQIQSMGERTALAYTSDEPEAVAACQMYGQEMIARLIEDTLASLAVKAVQNGYKRIITAGGETGGAVIRALGFRDFYIGGSIAPGVPVMIPTARPEMRLVLKSGNFGQEDFFKRALECTGEGS